MSKDRYTIIHSNTEYTKDLSDFLRKDVVLNILIGEYLYIGFYKPFNNVYFALETPNALESTLTIEKHYKGVWEQVDRLRDDTYGMSESGLISWVEDDDDNESTKTTVNGKELFFYRISSDQDLDMTVRAIGVLFSDDKDIFLESPILDNDRYRKRVVGSDTSYMRIHLQVKDYLLQELRNKGIQKYNSENDDDRIKLFRQITEFDLFDLDEVKLASRMLAMSNIYYKLSDEVDDKWSSEGDRYRQEYYRALDIAFVSIDKNDDGQLDAFENMKPIKNIRITR